MVLEGKVVRLEPLDLSHHAALCEVGLDPELWRITTTRIPSAEGMAEYIQTAIAARNAGSAIPFATIDRESSRVVGSTRFANIDVANKHGEIGWTWIARPWQRTAINTEAKFLMLKHAFEDLGWIRVELKTDRLNTRSRNAILRIGARQEGIFRNHMILANGRVRDSVWFSVIAEEWPKVRAGLEAKLAAARHSEGLMEIHSLGDAEIEDLHHMFQKEWWTEGRTLEDTRRMIAETRVVVGLVDARSRRLAAFARAVTDHTFKALLLDVIVDESFRGSGAGRKLMDAVLRHPLLAGVRHIELYCRPELMPFYEKWGFTETSADLRFMRRG